MSNTEEARSDPSGGKSGASPSAPGSGKKSNTVSIDPATKPNSDALPQSSPVPDAKHDLEEGRKTR